MKQITCLSKQDFYVSVKWQAQPRGNGGGGTGVGGYFKEQIAQTY